MQTESSARIARLETLIDEKARENVELKDELVQQHAALQREIAELRRENAELRRATWHAIHNSMDLLTAIKRDVENEEQRLEKILGRPVTKDSRLMDEMIKDRQAEIAARP